MTLRRIGDLFRQNIVLFKFYLLFGYFCVLFYFFLHWSVSEQYISVKLPMLMAKSVIIVLKMIGIEAMANDAVVLLPGGFRFTIIYHCAGVFGMMIYAAAVLAYPAKVLEKVYGLLFGWFGLYTINTIRMAALGIIGMRWRKHFDFYHEFLWQGIFILFVIGFWVFWKEKMIREENPKSPDDPSGESPDKIQPSFG